MENISGAPPSPTEDTPDTTPTPTGKTPDTTASPTEDISGTPPSPTEDTPCTTPSYTGKTPDKTPSPSEDTSAGTTPSPTENPPPTTTSPTEETSDTTQLPDVNTDPDISTTVASLVTATSKPETYPSGTTQTDITVGTDSRSPVTQLISTELPLRTDTKNPETFTVVFTTSVETSTLPVVTSLMTSDPTINPIITPKTTPMTNAPMTTITSNSMTSAPAPTIPTTPMTSASTATIPTTPMTSASTPTIPTTPMTSALTSTIPTTSLSSALVTTPTTITSVKTTLMAATTKATIAATTPKENGPTPACLNGGTQDGTKCVCLDEFYGPICEFLIDKIEVGLEVNTTVKVDLQIKNQQYTQELEDPSSPEYEKFETNFKKEIEPVYRSIDGFKEVLILSVKQGDALDNLRISKKVKRQLEEPKAHNGGCRDNNCKPENKIVIYQQRNNEKSETLLQPSIAQHEETQRIIKKEGKEDHDDISADRNLGIKNTQRYGVIVEHEVIVEAKYAADVSVSETYDAIVKKVEAQLEDLENNNNCSDANSLCVANVTVKETPVLTEQEICKNRVGEGLKDFYSPFVTSKGLTCISLCDPNSDKQYTCNTGTCRVQNITGPECLCPEPDKYIYSTDRCEGRLSKAAVYGGVGAAIAVLFIAVLVAVFLLVRARKHAKMAALLKDQDDHWYEDEDDKWSVPLGHDNHNVGDTTDFSSSTKEIFKLKLDKIDTTIQVKIQRPSLYPDWMATYT